MRPCAHNQDGADGHETSHEAHPYRRWLTSESGSFWHEVLDEAGDEEGRGEDHQVSARNMPSAAPSCPRAQPGSVGGQGISQVSVTIVIVVAPTWPMGKTSAVVLSIDDVHPGRSTDAYEAGGDLEAGVLGNLLRLLSTHDEVKATLFITPDWREICPFPTRAISGLPLVHRWLYLSPVLPRKTMAIDRHGDFIAFLKELPRCEFALHGLHHVHRGPHIPVEFQNESLNSCMRSVKRARELFLRAGLPSPRGFCPPAWSAPPNLLAALGLQGFQYVSTTRDIDSHVELGALSMGSGPRGFPAYAAHIIKRLQLVHIPVNFQATSPIGRAVQILEQGGLLSIKAHAIRDACGHIARDYLDSSYVSYLSQLISVIGERFGESVWWATFDEVSEHLLRSGNEWHKAVS